MKRLVLLFSSLLATYSAMAQLTVNSTLTPTQLVQSYLVGGGVSVSNVTFNGAPGNTPNIQCGYFNGVNTTLTMNEGLILSSGNISNAVGPNNQSGVSTAVGGSAYDADLNAICAFGVYDAAILEFDFVPMGDTVSFSFIFASDEYIEYVGSGINDAFGIFLSGPGITGPFTNNAVNMATVPGTSIPISIDNVSPFTNAAYYVNNGDGFTAPYNSNPMYVQYDGMTTKIVASYPVTCGNTYHIKFAIGDGSDQVFDSGVFIEGGSFSSNGVNVSLLTPTLPNATQGVVYEGCLIGSTVDFTFTRPDTSLNDTVYFSLGGNAVNGVDYSAILNNFVVFGPGQDSVTLTINIPNDGVIEGVDTLIISVLGVTACGNITTNSAILYINDPYDLLPFAGNDTIYNCPGQTFSYNGIILNGNPPYNYTWSSGVNGQFVNYTINQLSGDTLILSVMDGCGYFGSDTIFFSHVPPAPLFANAGPDTTLTCAGQSVLLNGSYSGGSGDTTYFNWSNGAMTAQTLVQPLTTTTYILTVTNTCLQMDTDTMVVTVPPYIPLSLFVSDTLIEVSCPGNTADFVAYVTAGGTSPYTYQWSTGDLDSTASVVVNGPDSLLFTATDACGLDTSLYVYVDIMNGNLNIHTTSGRFCLNSDSTALVAYQVQGGISPLVYSWDIPVNALGVVQDTIAMNYLIQGAVNGDYIFTVTDACGNTASDTSNVIMISCSLDIPNVISPNGDGVNDVFYVDGLQYHPNSILRVYNRWGQLVYLDNNYLNNWDGGSLPQGTYFYIIELTDGTIPAQYTGTLTIFY